MENDPNKKESKGKRILKKALRRNSKSNSNNSQNDPRNGVPRTRSGEQRRASPEDAAAPDVPDKLLDIQEENNLAHEEGEPTTSRILKTKFKVPTKSQETNRSQAGPSKKNLKRKVEEEELGGASGGSGASTGSDNDADDKDPGKDKKKKNRCAVCRKKVGLTGFECRCGGLFCAVHRYSDKHDCSFDYRELGAQEIRRNNPVVVSQKIHKI